MSFSQNLVFELPFWQVILGAFSFIYLVYRWFVRPVHLKSPNFYSHKKTKIQKLKKRFFPPPYPNGWIKITSAADVADDQVKSISALGREFVAFRGKNGKVGVLDAYCPHLGAHLGQGGRVTAKGTLECPFHKWTFCPDGQADEIPYCRTEVPARAKTKSYHVREHLGMVYIWFDAEDREPQWELKYHEDISESGKFYYVTMKQMEFDQHVLEMHLNGQDYYHFQTLHRPLPLPFLEKFLFGLHELKAKFNTDKGSPAPPHIFFFNEKMIKVFLFGLVSIVPSFVLRSIETNVTFEGPCIVHFSVKTIFGEMRMIKNLMPVEPFHQYVEARWWAEKTVPRWMAQIMAVVAGKALEQDRQVWENKIYHHKPMLVAGDGPFPAFKKFYMQFYSESSNKICEDELAW
eukprot:CAMPEP_0184007344 /NCGR_PEP_ID=MMETSP0954-20121128/1270_1 /TAXON_ID=627963 /ORGANISM="Aplanochytrium sp, Strain PBS07" /LENGTH=403 /DNA_ID=CAMNT_0026286141 /DNA_START=67 /DNA_END=1278 /DNA_ORIENTATION=-